MDSVGKTCGKCTTNVRSIGHCPKNQTIERQSVRLIDEFKELLHLQLKYLGGRSMSGVERDSAVTAKEGGTEKRERWHGSHRRKTPKEGKYHVPHRNQHRSKRRLQELHQKPEHAGELAGKALDGLAHQPRVRRRGRPRDLRKHARSGSRNGPGG